jgi:hypothetical protein
MLPNAIEHIAHLYARVHFTSPLRWCFPFRTGGCPKIPLHAPESDDG